MWVCVRERESGRTIKQFRMAHTPIRRKGWVRDRGVSVEAGRAGQGRGVCARDVVARSSIFGGCFVDVVALGSV